MRLEKKTQTSGNGRSWRVGPPRLIGRQDSTPSKSPLGESQTKSGRLVDPPLLWPGARVEPGRLVDLPRSAQRQSGARPPGRPWPRQWEREDRKGPACTPRAVTSRRLPSPLLSLPLGPEGRDTCAHGGDGRDRRAQPAPRPRSSPLGKGTAGPPCDAPGLASAPRLSPPSPVPARGRGPAAGKRRRARHPEAGRRRQGRPRLLPLSSTRAHNPHCVEGGGPPAARGRGRARGGRRARGWHGPPQRPGPAGRPAGRPASRRDKTVCRGLTFNRSQRGSCSATYETPTQKQVVYEWFSTRFPTNVRCVTGEGAAAFPAAPRVPGRRALRTGPRSRRAAGRAATRPEGRGRRPAGGDGGGPAIRGQPRLPRRCRIVPPGRDSDLEAFSHNPTDGSFAPLAPQPSTYTKCLNLRFLSY